MSLRPLPTPTWVLLEGLSDVAAVRAVASTLGLDLDASEVRLVDMGGATNVRRHLRAAADQERSPRVIGMCDVKEGGFVVRALRDLLCDVRSAADLPRWGFQLCDRDLEDELLRALTPSQVSAVLSGLGLTDRFAAFRRQPAWSGRDLHEQLHRFSGVASGRKELMAQALAGALDVTRLPPPIAALVGSLRQDGPTLERLRATA
ncbi:MAG: TOPRIM nucleotidyl transferase/hydrolase domain-containing protein [Humibacillus sp.]